MCLQGVSKVAELFDITGLVTPIVATMKIDLDHDLVKRMLNWDDNLPDETTMDTLRELISAELISAELIIAELIFADSMS